MSDVTLSSKNYASYDFSNTQLVSQDRVNDLLKNFHTDEVRFTLDEKHQLTAFKLPKKKDNSFVAFFKKIFSSSYRHERTLLKNYEKLSQNATFNKKVTQELLDKLVNAGVKGNFIKQRFDKALEQNPNFEITSGLAFSDKIEMAHFLVSFRTSLV